MGIMDFLFGENETKTTMPDWLKDLGKFGSDRAQAVSNLGFAPWQGPDVAAFSPMQNAAFAGTNSAASAYGMPTSQGNGMPAPQTFAGGVQGYSSYPQFQAQLEAMKASQPELFNAYSQMFPNAGLGQARPQGGGQGNGPGGGQGQPTAPAQYQPLAPGQSTGPGPNLGHRGGNAWDDRASGSGQMRPRARPDYDITQPRPEFNGLLDRFDGGGPGAGLVTGLRNGREGLLNALFGRRA